MRAAVYERLETFVVRDFPDVELAATDLLLRVEACGVCGSDVASYLHGHYVVPGQVLGHEMSAIVAAIGSGLVGLAVGDRVAVRPARSCGVCSYCQGGSPHLCGESGLRTLGYGARGGYADLVLITEAVVGADVIVVPADLGPNEVLWAEPLAVAVHAVSLVLGSATEAVLDSLLVTGGGSVGLCVLAAARAAGFSSVVLSEPRADRRAAGAVLGARTVTPDEMVGLGEFAAVVDASGSAVAIAAAAEVLAPGGRIVLVGLGDRPVPWPIGSGTVMASFAYTDADFRLAVEHIVTGRVRLGRFVTHQFGLSDTGAAIAASAQDPAVVKAAVVPGLSTTPQSPEPV